MIAHIFKISYIKVKLLQILCLLQRLDKFINTVIGINKFNIRILKNISTQLKFYIPIKIW